MSNVFGTIWLVRGSHNVHRDLALPEQFRPPVTWFVAVFQAVGGQLGFTFAERDVAGGVIAALMPAISVSVSGDEWALFISSDSVRSWRGFGDRVWVCAKSRALDELATRLAARKAARTKNRLLARYGRPAAHVPSSPVDGLLRKYPVVLWPLHLTDDLSVGVVHALWYGFSSSKGDYAVCVGEDADEVAVRLAEELPCGAAVRVIDSAAHLPVW